MKKGRTGQSKLIEGGMERLENTEEYKRKVEVIKKEVNAKHSLTFSNEKNLAKRILIVIKREVEIRRRISELSSLKNLHILHTYQI